MGYRLFKVEPVFTCPLGCINPEAIAVSEIAGHTLLGEWTTERAVSDRKRNQIERYVGLTGEDLTNAALVPAAAANSLGTWLVVHPEGTDSYRTVVRDEAWSRLLMSYCEQLDAGGIAVRYCFGDLSDQPLAQVLRDGIVANRVPNYILVSMDDLQSEELAAAVVQQVVAFAAGRRMTFTLDDIGKGVFEVWARIDYLKQRDLRRCISRVIRKLVRDQDCRDILRRPEAGSNEWTIVFPGGRFERFIGRLGRVGDEFLDGIRDIDEQMMFTDGIEEWDDQLF